MRLQQTLALISILFLWHCGEDDPSTESAETSSAATGQAWLVEALHDPDYQKACDEIPGCLEAQAPWPGKTEMIWRVQVIRESSGDISIGAVDTVEVPEGDGVPVGPLRGDYLLAGLDGSGGSVDAQLITFPRTLRLEFDGGQTAPELTDLNDKRVDTTGYLRALSPIQTIAVLNETGDSLATASPPPVTVASLTRGVSSSPGFATPVWALTTPGTGLPAYCSHVQVLEGEPDRAFAGTLAFEGLVTLEKPEPTQLAVVKEALNRMTPLLCQSVSRIAFASFPAMKRYAAGAVLQAGEGHLIMINTASSGHSEESLKNSYGSRLSLADTILHESGHCVEALLNSVGNDPGLYGGAWPGTTRSLATGTIDHVRLKKGFGEEWRRVHESFVEHDWANSYSESGLVTGWSSELSSKEVADGGFMTGYGSNIWWDDIAEYIAESTMSRDLVRAGLTGENRIDLGCEQMQAYTDTGVPARLAALYTKMLFIRDLGLVDPANVDACMGPNLRLPSMTEGFDFWSGTTKLRSFNSDVSAGIGTDTLGNRVFEIKGAGRAEFSG